MAEGLEVWKVEAAILTFGPGGPSGTRLAPWPPAHDLEAEQTAFDGAVVERRSLRRLEADELRQARVAGQEARGSAREVLLQRIAQLWIKPGERVRVAESHAIGRIGDHQAGGTGRGPRERIGF